jgi:gallate dioxygenase
LRRVVEEFPDRVLWGTDWPHPNLKDHMPDDGLLVDFIPISRPPPSCSKSCWWTTPCACTGPRALRGHAPTLDVPGTIIFDAEQPQGYWLNQFCMSLMKAENRERFKADERAYLDEWPMTEEQKQAVLARDLNWCMRTGGNIYFLAKIGATDGKSFQQMAGSMTGMTEEEYRAMMMAAAALPKATAMWARTATRRRTASPKAAQAGKNRKATDMARITASVFTSHVPAIGAAMDLGKTQEAYWRPCSRATTSPPVDEGQQARRDLPGLQRPRHGLQPGLIPTFAIGTAAEFQPADEGWGPRPCPRWSAIPSWPATLPSP